MRTSMAFIFAGFVALGCSTPPAATMAEEPAASPSAAPEGSAVVNDKVVHTEAEWRQILTPEQYRVMREKDTERPNTGEYCHVFKPGLYVCAACGAELFRADAKFHSGTGWPSFVKPIRPDAIIERKDTSYGMTRTEALCRRCESHLGHVFDDGPPPLGTRYCINSVALKLVPEPAAASASSEPTGKQL